MSHKLKVGDKVRRLNGHHGKFREGSVGEVEEVYFNCYDIRLKGDEPDIRHDPDNLELVEPTHNCDQKPIADHCLECLVQSANNGLQALYRLKANHQKDIQVRNLAYTSDVYRDIDKDFNSLKWEEERKIRIKPKPKFEEFYVGPESIAAKGVERIPLGSWLVKLEGDTLHVGCKAFNAKQLMNALADLTRNSSECYFVSGHRLGCMRSGIICDGNEQISWADADRILVALEKGL